MTARKIIHLKSKNTGATRSIFVDSEDKDAWVGVPVDNRNASSVHWLKMIWKQIKKINSMDDNPIDNWTDADEKKIRGNE